MAGWFGLSQVRTTALEQALAVEGVLYEASVTGVVELVTETDYSIQVQLEAEQVLWNQQVLETNDIILREERNPESSLLISLQPGNRVCVDGDVRSFSAPTNPGEFDQKKYYYGRGITAVMNVEACRLLDGRSYWLAEKMQRVKEEIREGIRQVAADAGEYGLYLAVLLGDKREMADETKSLFQNGGIAHLLAISGLHLSIMGMGVRKLLQMVYVPPVPAGIIASGGLLLYVIMIGGEASAWRAWIMFTVMLVGRMLGRTYDLLSALGLAGILLLLDQPLYIFQSGFQLSFGAMMGIGAVSPIMQEWWKTGRKTDRAPGNGQILLRFLGETLVGSIAIQLVTMPITAYHFYQIPVYGIVLNLLAIPMMTYALTSVLCGTLLGIIWPAGGIFISGTAHYTFQLLEELCRYIERMPEAVLVTGQPSVRQIAGYYILLAVILLLMKRIAGSGKKTRAFLKRKQNKVLRLGNIFILYLVFIVLLLPAHENSLEITMLDVGQGDGIVLRLPDGNTCLIDGGSSSVDSVGDKRILPYLKHEGIGDIAMIFLTHGDTDHINGIAEVLEDPVIDIGGIAVPGVIVDQAAWEEIFLLAAARNIPVYRLTAGDVWSCGDVELKVLHPSGDFTDGSANSASLVLDLSYQDFNAIFMGDLETEQETELLPVLSDVALLKVGHHGSRDSTCVEFLDIIKPELALISCGKNNFYGHPHPETLERLAEAGAEIITTPESGAITVEYTGETVISTWFYGHYE